jgi:hypothetical protein
MAMKWNWMRQRYLVIEAERMIKVSSRVLQVSNFIKERIKPMNAPMRMSHLSLFKKMIFLGILFFPLFLTFLFVSNNVHVFNAIGLLHGFSQIVQIAQCS